MVAEQTISVTVPSVGESVTDGVLAKWIAEDGSAVQHGDSLCELETDKATLEIPSPADGVLHAGVAAGTEVAIGQQIATISVAAASAPSPSETPPPSHAPEKPTPEPNAAPTAAAPSGPAPIAAPTSPTVRRIAQERTIDPSTLSGSGKGGRITKDDVLATTSAPPAAAPAPESRTTTAPHSTPNEDRRVPLSRIRKRIAQNLVSSKHSAAHLTTFNEADMTEIIALRAQYRDLFEEHHGIRLGFMSFFVKATCHALLKYPEINAFLEGEEIIYHNSCHIGVALASDKGLIVPVIRNAEHKSFAEIEKEIKGYARAAQEHRLLPDALLGGTFTITNGGVFGSLLSTPIPNPPQTAILGMHTIQERPAVVNGDVVPRPLMYVALTYDHRLIDGKEGVGFLRTIKEYVEEPARLMLGL